MRDEQTGSTGEPQVQPKRDTEIQNCLLLVKRTDLNTIRRLIEAVSAAGQFRFYHQGIWLWEQFESRWSHCWANRKWVPGTSPGLWEFGKKRFIRTFPILNVLWPSRRKDLWSYPHDVWAVISFLKTESVSPAPVAARTAKANTSRVQCTISDSPDFSFWI